MASSSQYLLLVLLVFMSVPLYVSSMKFNLIPVHKPARYGLDDIQGTVIPNDQSTALFVNVWIGEPPRLQLLDMDTGSELLWIQCAPFKNSFSQTGPIFNPEDSSTFLNIPCSTHLCHQKCAVMTDFCPYFVAYGDGTNSTGTLGTDQLTFKDNDATITSVERDVVMGCGRNNFSPTATGESGILGLDAGPNSLVSQRGRKFSYCIGNLSDHTYPYNQLIIGESAEMQGDTTPLEIYNNFYYLTITGIALGEEKLNIDPKVFKRHWLGFGGMIIDSGTTYSYLPRPAFQALVNRVDELAMGFWNRVQLPEGDERVCYWGSIYPDTIGFPIMGFLFDGGAQMGSDAYSMFIQSSPRAFCLAFLPAKQNQKGIVGLLAQQRYNMGFDLDAKTLYITHTECQYLEDSSNS